MKAYKCDFCGELMEQPTEALPIKHNGVPYFVHFNLSIPGLLKSKEEFARTELCLKCLKHFVALAAGIADGG